MPIRTSEAHWKGGLKTGKGTMQVESGAFEGRYSSGTRFGDEKGSNPEELIGAAHAGCFSMALSMILEQAGFTPDKINTHAKVHIDAQAKGGYKITKIELSTYGQVKGINEDDFIKHAQTAKLNCPVSQALVNNVDISLDAHLI